MNEPKDMPDLSDILMDIAAGVARPAVVAPVEINQRWPVVRTGPREPINRITRRLIRERDNGRCRFCDKRTWRLELDHVVPWSAGGTDTSENLRSLCHDCNAHRSNYRTARDVVEIPVTLACDDCVKDWEDSFGFSRFGKRYHDRPALNAFCGNCGMTSFVTDPGRLR